MPSEELHSQTPASVRARQRRRLWVLIASLAVSAAFAVCLTRPRGLRREVNVVEMSDELRAICDREARRGGAEDAGLRTQGYPPPLVRWPMDERVTRLIYPGCELPLYQ